MFTGIVEELGMVESLEGGRLCIRAQKVLEDLAMGDSIAVNGACLTVVHLNRLGFAVDLAPETVRRTNLGTLRDGQVVNLERALAANGRLGGHIVQGHVNARGRFASARKEGEAVLIRFRSPRTLMPYIVEKGFIAVDGVSLTVVKKLSSAFTISVIPYTLANTNIKHRQDGDLVNLEVDILAKYVESLLASQR